MSLLSTSEWSLWQKVEFITSFATQEQKNRLEEEAVRAENMDCLDESVQALDHDGFGKKTSLGIRRRGAWNGTRQRNSAESIYQYMRSL
jgi:hypothetical protein